MDIEKKEIVSELNRALEIMGVKLIKEEETELDDAGNAVEIETTDTLDLGEEEQEVDGEGKAVEIETTDTLDLSEQEEEEVDANAIVTKKKEYRVMLKGDYGLHPFISYKYNKQTQKPVPNSAKMALRVSKNNQMHSSFDKLGTWAGSDPNKLDIYNTDKGLWDALKETSKLDKDKLPSSVTKKIIAWGIKTAQANGVDVDVASMWGSNWLKQDLTRWVDKSVFNKENKKTELGESGKYMSSSFENLGRDEGVTPKPDGFIIYFPNKKQVHFTQWGSPATQGWQEGVRYVNSKDEWYEFCRVIPEGLKASREWSNTTSEVSDNRGLRWKCKG